MSMISVYVFKYSSCALEIYPRINPSLTLQTFNKTIMFRMGFPTGSRNDSTIDPKEIFAGNSCFIP